MMSAKVAEKKPFCLEEATIEELHRAIQAGETTVVEIVQRYIARVRAYNGVSSVLITEDGKPIPPANGPA
jgi:amidase